MTQCILDADLRKKLNDCKEPVQLVDETGKVVARVVPEPASEPPRPYEPPKWTPEEHQRILAEPEFSTEELLDYLEKR